MTRGRVNARREPLVPLALHGRREAGILALLDTGFTGDLCLAERHRGRVAAVRIGRVESELADGTRRARPAYAAEVTFCGERRLVLLTFTAARTSLLGAGLLRGRRVEIDYVRLTVRVRDIAHPRPGAAAAIRRPRARRARRAARPITRGG